MILIDLELIKKLGLSAVGQQIQAEQYAYNDAGPKMDAALFQSKVKTGLQGANLFKRLIDLQQECIELSTGNFEKYLQNAKERGNVFDPFKTLLSHLKSTELGTLPSQIEQYEELCRFASTLSSRARKDQAIALDDPNAYLWDGNRIISPLSAGYQKAKEQQLYSREYNAIQLEYCLDGYNQFYGEVAALIQQHKKTGQAQQCAREILAFYK